MKTKTTSVTKIPALNKKMAWISISCPYKLFLIATDAVLIID